MEVLRAVPLPGGEAVDHPEVATQDYGHCRLTIVCRQCTSYVDTVLLGIHPNYNDCFNDFSATALTTLALLF